uniref:Uncharacterized protein n=1 Tax=Glossina pallidipes TaxID=7398 RepID=A0A1A9ZPT9_GLOPL
MSEERRAGKGFDVGTSHFLRECGPIFISPGKLDIDQPNYLLLIEMNSNQNNPSFQSESSNFWFCIIDGPSTRITTPVLSINSLCAELVILGKICSSNHRDLPSDHDNKIDSSLLSSLQR